jgi:hypothetical protein
MGALVDGFARKSINEEPRHEGLQMEKHKLLLIGAITFVNPSRPQPDPPRIGFQSPRPKCGA